MSTTTAAVFETTTATIIEAIENGAGTWTMPWSTRGIDFPTNPTTRKRYRGGNVLTLVAETMDKGYPSGEWATYKQWASIDAQVRKGEHGTSCIWWDITNNEEGAAADGTTEPHGRRRIMARTFVVFNVAQVDGHTTTPTVRDTPEQIATAETFFATIAATVEHRAEGQAYYSPASDLIVLPPFVDFIDAPSYYATSAHEHAHWTGHPSRLHRDLTGRYGTNAYAVEELIAELSAAFTCATLGISPTPRPDHAAYLAHWLDVLRSDPKALHTIAGKAQAATDHLARSSGLSNPEHDEREPALSRGSELHHTDGTYSQYGTDGTCVYMCLDVTKAVAERVR